MDPTAPAIESKAVEGGGRLERGRTWVGEELEGEAAGGMDMG